jgi:hypothetical protein
VLFRSKPVNHDTRKRRVAHPPLFYTLSRTVAVGAPRAFCVQFHDILYTLSLDILYTFAQAQACAEA